MKRTPQNCTIADKLYDRDDKERYVGDKCAGVRHWDDQEPIEVCKSCKHFCLYDEDEENL